MAELVGTMTEPSPSDTFSLLDLASQAEAVQLLLAGRPVEAKVAWFRARGTLSPIPSKSPSAPQVFSFVSNIGRECFFFIDGDDLVLIEGHTTTPVPRRPRV